MLTSIYFNFTQAARTTLTVFLELLKHYFRLFNTVENVWWLDSNHGSLVSKVTALPRVPQPLAAESISSCLVLVAATDISPSPHSDFQFSCFEVTRFIHSFVCLLSCLLVQENLFSLILSSESLSWKGGELSLNQSWPILKTLFKHMLVTHWQQNCLLHNSRVVIFYHRGHWTQSSVNSMQVCLQHRYSLLTITRSNLTQHLLRPSKIVGAGERSCANISLPVKVK